MAFKRGESVPIETLEDGGEFTTVALADLENKSSYTGALGIAMQTTASTAYQDEDGNFGRLSVVTSGQLPALVLGPCSAGDSLVLAMGDKDKVQWIDTGLYLKKGDGGTFISMEDVAAPSDATDTKAGTPVMVWVKSGTKSDKGQTFLLYEQYDDYLACIAWDGNTQAGDLVYVSKPYLLQRTIFDLDNYNGVFYTYTGMNTRIADNGVDEPENQKVTMDYVAGDIIIAIKPAGGTNLTDPDGNDIEWQDMNVDARAWAQDTSEV